MGIDYYSELHATQLLRFSRQAQRRHCVSHTSERWFYRSHNVRRFASGSFDGSTVPVKDAMFSTECDFLEMSGSDTFAFNSFF